jgi:hypothetical protein
MRGAILSGRCPRRTWCADGRASDFRDADVWQILELDIQEFRDLGDRVLVV